MLRIKPNIGAGVAATLTMLLSSAAMPGHAASSDDRFAAVRIEAQQVSGPVHMLTGAGGNIGASVGGDGTLIIDDQFAPLAERILAALEALDGGAPRFVLNTHFHGDHTGGNPIFGRDATIIAHDNVRARLRTADDFSAAGLPVVTYADTVRVHFNGDTLTVMHMPAGHTDGDSVVLFRDANVVHMGDLLFNGGFPFIDTANGGSVPGVIVALTRVLDMVPDDVRVIPGHGPLGDKDSIREALEMIRATRTLVTEALGSGKTVDDVVADGLGERWAAWGQGFIDEERWIRTLAAAPGAP